MGEEGRCGMTQRFRQAEASHGRTMEALVAELLVRLREEDWSAMTGDDDVLIAMIDNLRLYLATVNEIGPGLGDPWLGHHLLTVWEQAIERHRELDADYECLARQRALSEDALEAPLLQETLARLGVAFLLDALRPSQDLIDAVKRAKGDHGLQVAVVPDQEVNAWRTM